VKFKIDVSDRETGEVATLEVEATSAPSARRELRDAGYIVWATEPIALAGNRPVRQRPRVEEERLAQLTARAWHDTFQAHPVRWALWPLLRWCAATLFWLAAAVAFFHVELPVGAHRASPTAAELVQAAALVWGVGVVVGWPLARGRTARRQLADAQLVCRYCRRRGLVHTCVRGMLCRRLWGECGVCGIRWLL
jgi:hypothetical protein